jgi:ABC-2 type transport system permease protein
MNKIKTIVRKEWAEVFKNRLVLFTVAFLPLIMTALPLGILFAMRGEIPVDDGGEAVEGFTSELPEEFNTFCPPELADGECFQVYLVSQFMIMFMLIPLAIPATIAAYSIVGEKTTRSLEPLLATPITTAELLVGKSLSALIPAVVATYGAFAIYAIGAWFIISNRAVYAAMMDARWLLAIFVLGPLLSLSAVSTSMMVSSRVNDPRVAEQLSMVVIVPVLAVFFGQFAGLFIINRQLVLISSLVIFIIDIGLVYLAVRLFQRETILTRWKS